MWDRSAQFRHSCVHDTAHFDSVNRSGTARSLSDTLRSVSRQMRADIVAHLCSRLAPIVTELADSFAASNAQIGTRHCIIDNLLPVGIAEEIYASFPPSRRMRRLNSFREAKYTSKSLDRFHTLMSDVTFAFQESAVVEIVERITSLPKQSPDSHLYAGGLSAMEKGDFLRPHIDNSHDGSRINYRTLNLLYYVSPNWCIESGGNLELWDRTRTEHVTIVSRFNRLVIMETAPWSWHSVSKVLANERRCCVSNYYFSPVSPTGHEYFNVTSYSARPEEKFLRSLTWVDNQVRRVVRRLAPKGIARTDTYRSPKE